jgi:SNF2 family DNA or RNA helicase
VLRRRKKDIGEQLVTKTRRVIRVPLGREQSRVYQAHLEWKPKDKNGQEAFGARLQALRLAAVSPNSPLLTQAHGHAYTPKLATALTLIADALERREQVLVFSPFHDPLDTLAVRLLDAEVPFAVLDGRSSPDRRAAVAAAFRSPQSSILNPQSSIQVLLAGTECMAEGHNFPLCNNVVQVAYPWALDKVLQSEDRAWRLNSIRPLNVYRLITDGTIDRKMESLIGEKSDAAELVLDGHLLGETPEELNLAQLLQVAEADYAAGAHVLDESTLERDWPPLLARLRQAAATWHFHAPIAPPPFPAPAEPAKPDYWCALRSLLS